MATYRVTGPDGATYDVTAPDNASEADVFKVLSGHIKAGSPAPSQSAPQPEAPGIPAKMGWKTYVGEPPKTERPALEGTVTTGPALPAADVAMKEFGIDLTKPVETVRAAIAALPQEKQRRALDMWATHTATAGRDAKTEGQKIVGNVNDALEAVARGTPLGSWGDEIDAGLKAAAYKMTGGGIGAPYDESAAWARARQKAFDQRNPVLSPALQITGAVASAPATPALQPFRGASMLGKIGNGMATGGAYGTIYGAGLGEDGLGDRALRAGEGLALGTAIGGAAAPVASGLANAYKYGRDAMRPLPPALTGMSRGAVKRVNRAMQDDALYVPVPANRNGFVPPPPRQGAASYTNQRNQLGYEGMLMDMGTNLQGQAAALATKPGPGKAMVKGALENRAAGAKGRIEYDTNQALGPAKNLVELEEQFTKQSRKMADPLYEQFRQTPIKPSEALYGLLDRAKAAGVYDEALKNMQKRGFDPVETFYKGYKNSGVDNSALNARFLDEVKRAADGVASEYFRKGNNTQGSIYADIANGIRSEVDRILSPNNPAASIYARARDAAGEGLQFSEALDMGRKAFSRGTHPDQMKADMSRMNYLQRDAYREGGRGWARDVMGNATSALNTSEANLAAARDTRKAFGSDYAREKLRMLAQEPKYPPGVVPPPPKTGNPEKMIDRLDTETRFAQTTNDVLANSKTAERQAAQREVPGTGDAEEFTKTVGLRDWSGAAMQAAAKVANWLQMGALNARGARINEDMAKMLTAQGPERDRIAQSLMQFGQSRAVTQRQRDALEEILTKLLQAPRQHVIGGATAN